MRRLVAAVGGLLVALALANGLATAQQKPNIIMIMGDDIGRSTSNGYYRVVPAP